MTLHCEECGRPMSASEPTRQTCDGPICARCGEIADMRLRAANDTVFEDWDAVRPRAERDRSDSGV